MDNEQINNIFRLSKGSKVVGTICSQSDMRVDGILEGNVLCKGRLVIGESAVVTGAIVAASCDVFGSVTGEFYINEGFALKETSKCNGPVRTKKIAIEMGADFAGSCSTITEEEFAAAEKRISGESEIAPPAEL